MSLTRLLATRFFLSIIARNFAEAERLLDRLRERPTHTQWSKGYLTCLEGLMITFRSNNDKNLYMSRIQLDDRKIEELRKEFTRRSRAPLSGDYDRGYFKAWSEFMRIMGSRRLSSNQGLHGDPKRE
jgi:hypothetical protein